MPSVLFAGKAEQDDVGFLPALRTERAVGVGQQSIVGIHKLHILSVRGCQSGIAGSRQSGIFLAYIDDIPCHLPEHFLRGAFTSVIHHDDLEILLRHSALHHERAHLQHTPQAFSQQRERFAVVGDDE